ncbi:MAG: alpha/beta fold hydrolase [Gammaproteobacteria bacterium]
MLTNVLLVLGLLILAVMVLELGFPKLATKLAMGLERRRNGLSWREKTVDGMTIRYLEGGQGDTLVLVHGFGADKDNFTRIAGALTKHFHVVVPDLPGFGESTRLHDAPYPFEDQTRRLHGILHGLGITRCHIGGSSMGGAIAVLYGAFYPDEVMTRWLLAPAGVEGSEDSVMAAHYRATQEMLLLPTSVADFKRVMELAVEKKIFLPGSVRRTLGERAMQDQVLHTRIFEEIALAPPVNDTVSTSPAPTLVVWGDKDQVLHVSGAPILRDALPTAEMIVMPGIGHLPMVEAPAQTARDYIDFVQRHTAGH